jgi:hypothetical protein
MGRSNFKNYFGKSTTIQTRRPFDHDFEHTVLNKIETISISLS